MFSTRRFTRSSIDAFGRWIYEHSWFRDVGDDAIADTMTESFTSDLTTAIELYTILQNLLKFTTLTNLG